MGSAAGACDRHGCYALIGLSAFNRLELGDLGQAATDHYQRIAADLEKFDRLPSEAFLKASIRDTVDPFWVTAARQLFSNGAGVLCAQALARIAATQFDAITD